MQAWDHPQDCQSAVPPGHLMPFSSVWREACRRTIHTVDPLLPRSTGLRRCLQDCLLLSRHQAGFQTAVLPDDQILVCSDFCPDSCCSSLSWMRIHCFSCCCWSRCHYCCPCFRCFCCLCCPHCLRRLLSLSRLCVRRRSCFLFHPLNPLFRCFSCRHHFHFCSSHHCLHFRCSCPHRRDHVYFHLRLCHHHRLRQNQRPYFVHRFQCS